MMAIANSPAPGVGRGPVTGRRLTTCKAKGSKTMNA